MGNVVPFPKIHPDYQPAQLTLDGKMVQHPAPTGMHIGPHQREVLRALGFGSLTSTQAGTICHATRGWCGYGCPYGEWNKRGYENSRYGGCNIHLPGSQWYEQTRYHGTGCCPYAASEGTEVMKRLKRRGFVVKIGGLWYTADQWGTDGHTNT